MRGPVNSSVKLKISRKESKDPIDVTLTRDVIKIKPVRSKVEGSDVAYIRLTQFNEQTFDGMPRRDRQTVERHRRRQDQGLRHRRCATTRAACSTRR